MDSVFSLPIFQVVWKVIGLIIMIVGLSMLGSSAKLSLERSKNGSFGAKIMSVLDEALFGILLIAGLYVIFFVNDFGTLITFASKIVVWIWDTIIVPLLQFFGVPL